MNLHRFINENAGQVHAPNVRSKEAFFFKYEAGFFEQIHDTYVCNSEY